MGQVTRTLFFINYVLVDNAKRSSTLQKWKLHYNEDDLPSQRSTGLRISMKDLKKKSTESHQLSFFFSRQANRAYSLQRLSHPDYTGMGDGIWWGILFPVALRNEDYFHELAIIFISKWGRKQDTSPNPITPINVTIKKWRLYSKNCHIHPPFFLPIFFWV